MDNAGEIRQTIANDSDEMATSDIQLTRLVLHRVVQCLDSLSRLTYTQCDTCPVEHDFKHDDRTIRDVCFSTAKRR